MRGGDFTTAGGTTVNYVAAWTGSSWGAMNGGMNSRVVALALSGGTLYVGGDFTFAGTVQATYIAAWNGSWSSLNSGMNFQGVNALAVSGNTLFAAGDFTVAGGGDRSTISPPGTAAPGRPSAVA